MLDPTILNKEHITQYPMMVHTYGGPGTQKVTKQFSLGWATYLTSTHNIISASIDGRGSAARGNRFLHKVHHHLGTVEIADQFRGAV